MAKQKSRSLVSADAKKKTKPVAPVVNLLDEDDWVIVRKQKITILIPPLPGEVQLIASSNTGESQPEIPSAAIDKDIPILAATSPKNSAPESEAKSLSQAPECSIPAAKIVHPPPLLSNPKTSKKAKKLISSRGRTSNHGLSSLKLRKHALLFGDGMPLLNQSMRAINIEKKIHKAGGLSSWLISLGLERFVKIFQQKKVNKFQLANLNMKKLKDMGAFAVGPRRKLMHALDCLCQPYCFEHVRLSSV